MNAFEERKNRIQFIEEGHKYIVDNNPNIIYTSVTTFVHELFPKFNADLIIYGMMKSPNWPNSQYFGKTSDEIKEEWENKKNLAAKLGTELHAMIENFYNSQNVVYEDKCFTDFLKFEEEIVQKESFSCFLSEARIFDEDIRIAGSVDMIYNTKDKSSDCYIFDWKRTPTLKKTGGYGKGLNPINKYPNNNFSHYTMQLNLYKYIIEKNYNKKVIGLFLVLFHPTRESYELVEIPIITEDIEKLVKYRLEKISNNEG